MDEFCPLPQHIRNCVKKRRKRTFWIGLIVKKRLQPVF
jgi:hypothetical protein